MKRLLEEWKNFLLEAEAKYSGIIKINPDQEVISKVKKLQQYIKDPTAVNLPEEAIHVTLVHQNVLKPFRKKLKTLDLPKAPTPVIDFDKGVKIKKSGEKKSWAIELTNQKEMRDYVQNIMELLESEDTNPEPERVFHISLANLTGSPHDSVR